MINALGGSGGGGGLDAGMLAKVLPILAPLVLSYLAKSRGGAGGGGGGGGLSDVLGGLLGGGGGLGDILGGLVGGSGGGGLTGSWRACRLVVDTGLHALGWTGQQAIDVMVAHAPVGHEEVVVEVDRYIGIPGQALAYKVGQREILRLRDDARTSLGSAFTIAGFHDAVLAGGTISLRVLRDRVARWVAAGR